MSSDDSSQATGSTRTGLRTTLLLALLTFVLGIGATALFIRQYRSWLPRSTQVMIDPAVATAPDPGQVGAGFEPPPEAGSAARSLDSDHLDSRQTMIAGQLAAIEARTALVDQAARAAAGNAGRAEGLLIAFAARRAIDRGLALGAIEPQLRLRFGNSQSRAVASIIQAARAPVTLEDLREGIDALAPELTSGVVTSGWFNSLRRELASLIVIRHEGTPSPRAADRIIRIRRLLDAGRVEAALAEVGRLPGAPQAEHWIDAAGRYVQAHEALDMIETAAIAGSGAGSGADAGGMNTTPANRAPAPAASASTSATQASGASGALPR